MSHISIPIDMVWSNGEWQIARAHGRDRASGPDGALAVRDASSRLAGDVLKVDGPNRCRGQFPLDGGADLPPMLRAILEAELGERSPRLRGILDAPNGARRDDAGVCLLYTSNRAFSHYRW